MRYFFRRNPPAQNGRRSLATFRSSSFYLPPSGSMSFPESFSLSTRFSLPSSPNVGRLCPLFLQFPESRFPFPFPSIRRLLLHLKPVPLHTPTNCHVHQALLAVETVAFSFRPFFLRPEPLYPLLDRLLADVHSSFLLFSIAFALSFLPPGFLSGALLLSRHLKVER